MAGSNRLLKENEIVFKMGDPADAMYIVRKGSLKVFFTKGTEEVELAILKDGSIVGEMAFFDNKPRSASVRATTVTEVNVITRADFEKLVLQVPKWVVSMMQSLVTRLRQTNEKVQSLEASQASKNSSVEGASAALMLPYQKHPFQHTLRALKLMIMALAKDGQKEANGVILSAEIPKKLWEDFVGEDIDLYEKVLVTAEKGKLLSRKFDVQKNPVISFSNRGTFVHFVEFFSTIAKTFKPIKPYYSPDAVALFCAMVETAVASGYETLNVNFVNVRTIYASKGVNVTGWANALGELTNIPELKISKVGPDILARIYVKEHKFIAQYLKTIQLFVDAKLI